MRNLFSTKLRVIVVVAILITAALAVAAGVSSQTAPGTALQTLLTPIKSGFNALTKQAEQYYSYMFRYAHRQRLHDYLSPCGACRQPDTQD